MQQTSKLSIVVDTSNAKQRLSDFTRQLNDATKAATNMAEKVEKSLSAKGSKGASSQISGLTRETNLLGTAAQQAALMQDRLTTSAAKTATAQANATKAAANAATAQNRQAASANSVTISNNSLAQSEFALERAMNKTIATETRLQIIQNSLAGSALRLGTAQQNAAISATLGQDKLTASTHRVAAAANAANLASSKFVISQHNEATAALRTTTQLTRLSTEQQRLAAATSAASGAASRAGVNLNSLSASAIRVQREEARLQAELLRTNALAERQAAAAARAAAGLNGMGNAADRANHASRGLHGSMNKLYTVLNSGLVAVTGLGFIKTAAEMQNLNNQIRLVTDSEREYLLMKQMAGKIANDNFADINATIGLYQKSVRALTNLGKSQADSIKFTEAVSLAMRTGGRSAGENAAAILQLGQAMGAGVIMGDEFRSISENAPVLLQLVAKEMGVLQGDLKKLSADGKITAEIMYNALTKNMGALEELAKKMPLTMGQAFTVAKNRYKEYTDEMMNSTGGVSDKISGMLIKISANFDTIAKVGMAGMVLGLVSITANLATATKAMALFNFVANANPLILIASGFIAVNSAIFGVNEVLTISGIVMGDFFDGMGTMLSDAGDQWRTFSDKVKEELGIINDEVEKSNKKNTKNFVGFYNETEEGFAGVIQGLGTGLGAMGLVITTVLETIGRTVFDMIVSLENVGRAAHNAGSWVREQLGFDSNRVEYKSYVSVNPLDNYQDQLDTLVEGMADYGKKLNQGLKPKKKSGEYDPDYVAPLRSSLMQTDIAGILQGGQSVRVKGAANDSPYLQNNQANRNPVSQQAVIEQQIRAEKELAETRKEAAKELEKQNKEARSSAHIKYTNQGASRNLKLNEDLVKRMSFLQEMDIEWRVNSGGQKQGVSRGIVGSTAHNDGMAGDGGLYRDGVKLDWNKKSDLPLLMAVVEEAASRGVNGIGAGNDYMGAGNFHFGVQKNAAAWGKGGKGVNAPAWLKNAHAQGLARKQDDSFFGKYQNRIIQESAAQAKEAERAMKERLAIQAGLYQDYGTAREKIAIKLNTKLADIEKSGFDDAKKKDYRDQAVRDAEIELSTYQETLDKKVDALDAWQKTERSLLAEARNNAKFDALTDTELRKSENEEYLTYALKSADREFEHKTKLLNLSQEEEALGLFEYASTDRRMFEEGWRLKIARAKLATDELKDIRIKAYEAEYAKDQELFNLNEKKKRLELNSYKMSDTESMVAGIALEREGIALSNATPEQKREQSRAAGQPIRDSLEGMLNGFDNSGTAEGNPYLAVEAQRAENLEKIKAYEEEIGLIEGDAREERLAAEREYYRAKAELVVNDGESIMGSLASIAKDTMGEQSSIFKAMFAMEKGFAIARSIMNIQVALSSAAASLPFPANLGAIATVAMEGASIISSLKAVAGAGFEKGGYTGSMGTKDIAGVVHGQEYVFDAQSTKRIGVDNLNAMRRGENPKGGGDVIINNYSSAKIEQRQDANGVTILDVRDEIKRGFTELRNPNSYNAKMVKSSFNTTVKR